MWTESKCECHILPASFCFYQISFCKKKNSWSKHECLTRWYMGWCFKIIHFLIDLVSTESSLKWKIPLIRQPQCSLCHYVGVKHFCFYKWIFLRWLIWQPSIEFSRVVSASQLLNRPIILLHCPHRKVWSLFLITWVAKAKINSYHYTCLHCLW